MQIGPLSVDDGRLAAFCEKWGIAELAVFGSVLRDDFRPDSDVDFLVTWKEGRLPGSIFDIVRMQDELSVIVGREAGIAERRLVERSKNPYRRRNILDSATTVYAAA